MQSSNCPFQLTNNQLTFIFPPQFGILKADVSDFLEYYHLTQSCSGCTNQTINLRQLTNIKLNIDDRLLCELKISTTDFYYVLMALSIVSLLIPIILFIVRKIPAYSQIIMYLIIYHQLPLFLLFDNENPLLKSNVFAFFGFAFPWDKLPKMINRLDDYYYHTFIINYAYNMVYSILILIAIITVLSIILFWSHSLFPIIKQGFNARYLVKYTMNIVFLLFGAFYICSILPISILIAIFLQFKESGILVFLFLYLILPFILLCYLYHKRKYTLQIQSYQIKYYFPLLIHSFHQYASITNMALIVLLALSGALILSPNIVKYAVIIGLEGCFMLLQSFLKRRHSESTSRCTTTSSEEYKSSVCNYLVPTIYSLMRMIFYAILLIGSSLTLNIKGETIYGFCVLGVYIVSILCAVLMLMKQSIVPKENSNAASDSPILERLERSNSNRHLRVDWLDSEFDEQESNRDSKSKRDSKLKQSEIGNMDDLAQYLREYKV
eukprot:NODE_87_length_21893_cov_0.496559.p3 type:complete len:494 gc:universal NODE_87_length_21893_cov_0.496559:15544-14063(-)